MKRDGITEIARVTGGAETRTHWR